MSSPQTKEGLNTFNNIQEFRISQNNNGYKNKYF